MPSRAVRWAGGTLLATALLLASATPSFAPHVAQLQVTPNQVQPGGEVTVFGPRGYGRTNPVDIRFGSQDGPVIGTFQPNDELYAMWGPGTVRIPEDAKPGVHLLWATQTLAPSETHIRGVPARGEITVLGPGGTPIVGQRSGVGTEPQGVTLVEEEPVDTGTVLLIALGVAGIGLLIAGGAATFASRRRASSAEPVPSR